MSLDQFNVTFVNQRSQSTNPTSDATRAALIQEEYTGQVEAIIERKSALQGWIPIRSVKGTSTVTNYAVGDVQLQVLQPGVTPNGSPGDFDKASLTIDTVILARNIVPLLDDLQNAFGARQELARAQGTKLAKFQDQAFFIQAAKAALRTTSRYDLEGHEGGTQVTIQSADVNDPAAINAAINTLLAQMEEKDVDPQGDDLIIALRPSTFYAFIQSEHIVNGEYITAEGNKVNGMIFKAYGVPVVRSNNVPYGKNITNHEMSKASNGNAYNGDFTKVVATAFSPRALLAGETIPRQSKIFFDDVSKHWHIDTWQAFGVTVSRPEFAGAIVTP